MKEIIIFVVYFTGIIFSFLIGMKMLRKGEDKTIGDSLFLIFISILSWLSVLIFLFIDSMGDNLPHHKNQKYM